MMISRYALPVLLLGFAVTVSAHEEGGCMCTANWEPVCGKNNETYGNACGAECVHEPIACQGECPCAPAEPCPGGATYITGPCFPKSWADAWAEHAAHLALDMLAYDKEAHLWYWGGASTCVGWGVHNARCDNSSRVCMGANHTYGYSNQQLAGVSDVVSQNLVKHPLCPQPEAVTVCEGHEILLECPSHLAVQVTDVFYGRRTNDVCEIDNWDGVECEAENALDAAHMRCYGLSECLLVASDLYLGGTSCTWTAKYLEVAFSCVTPPTAAPTEVPVPAPAVVPAPMVPVPVPAPGYFAPMVPVPVPAPAPMPAPQAGCSFDDGCPNPYGMCGADMEEFCQIAPCMACQMACEGFPDAQCFTNACGGCEAVWLDDTCARVTCGNVTTGGDSLVSNITTEMPTYSPTPAPVTIPTECSCLPEVAHLQAQIDQLTELLMEIDTYMSSHVHGPPDDHEPPHHTDAPAETSGMEPGDTTSMADGHDYTTLSPTY